MFLKSILLLLFYSYIGGALGYVELGGSKPTVRGANITLTAFISDPRTFGEKQFIFRNVEKQETVKILSSKKELIHVVQTNKDQYKAGLYAFEVKVFSRNEYDRDTFSLYDSARIRVPVTDQLNGNLRLIQNGIDRSHGLVFPNEPVKHNIALSEEELQFLTHDKNTYLVHWYINCSLIASTGLSLDYTYEDPYKTYNLEVLVEVEQNPFFPTILTTRPGMLANFKCAPIFDSGYTYGYYSATVRGGATDSSQRPPLRNWRTTQSSASRDSDETFRNTSPAPNSSSSPYRPWRTSERPTWTSRKPRVSSTTSTPTPNTSNSGVQSKCAESAQNTKISVKNGHLKIAMDMVFDGTFNITAFGIEGI